MIYIAILSGVILMVAFSCVNVSTSYDEMINDKEQEDFLKKYSGNYK